MLFLKQGSVSALRISNWTPFHLVSPQILKKFVRPWFEAMPKLILRNKKKWAGFKANRASQFLRCVIIISNNICLGINNNKIKKDLPLGK